MQTVAGAGAGGSRGWVRRANKENNCMIDDELNDEFNYSSQFLYMIHV
jgi:hypothetical protein